MASVNVYHIGVSICIMPAVSFSTCAFGDSCYLKESAERLHQKELDDEAREVL